MKRGFTLVELLVVISAIVILIAIFIAVYDQYQNRAYDSSAKSSASAVKTALERYYSENNEYPSAYALRGDGLQNGTLPSSATYTAMASKLDVPVSTLQNDTVQLVPVGAGGVNLDEAPRDRMFYATRGDNPDPLYGQAYQYGTCQYVVGSVSNAVITSYILFFWSSEQNAWLAAPSEHGPTSTSCSFTKL